MASLHETVSYYVRIIIATKMWIPNAFLHRVLTKMMADYFYAEKRVGVEMGLDKH